MNPWVIFALNLVWVGSLGVAWIEGKSQGKAEVEAEASRQEKLISAAVDEISTATAKAISTIKVNHVTVRQKLEREVAEKKVFSECRSGSDAVRMFNSTIPGGQGEIPGPGSVASGGLSGKDSASE